MPLVLLVTCTIKLFEQQIYTEQTKDKQKMYLSVLLPVAVAPALVVDDTSHHVQSPGQTCEPREADTLRGSPLHEIRREKSKPEGKICTTVWV